MINLSSPSSGTLFTAVERPSRRSGLQRSSSSTFFTSSYSSFSSPSSSPSSSSTCYFCRDLGILCAERSLPSWTLTKVDSSQKVRMMRVMMIIIIIFPGKCNHNFVLDEMLAVISGSFTGDKVRMSQTDQFSNKNVSRLFVVCRS